MHTAGKERSQTFAMKNDRNITQAHLIPEWMDKRKKALSDKQNVRDESGLQTAVRLCQL